MEIRVFEESDQREVVSLWKQVFGYAEPRNDPATVIRHKMAAQRNLFFVAVADGRLVGTVMGGYDGHRGWILFAGRRSGPSPTESRDGPDPPRRAGSGGGGLPQDQFAGSFIERCGHRVLRETRLPRRRADQHGEGV